MKKLVKSIAVIAALAMIGGGVLTSCYSGTDDDESKPVATTPTTPTTPDTPTTPTTPTTPDTPATAAFTVSGGVLTLTGDSYDYYLNKTNLQSTTGDNAWSSVSFDKWATKKGKTHFTVEDEYPNVSASDRVITLKVKGVAAIDVHVFDSNGGRDYTVKIGNAAAKTYQSVKNVEGNVIATGTTEETTIQIAGVSQSVYPVGVILYKTVPAAN